MCVAVSMLLCTSCVAGLPEPTRLKSPNGLVEVEFSAEGTELRWGVIKNGRRLVRPSQMGLVFAKTAQLSEMRVKSLSRRTSDTIWTNEIYRCHEVRDWFNEITIGLEETEPRGVVLPIGASEPEFVPRRLELVFRAYNEGVAFRYVVPEQPAFKGFQLLGEKTEWRFPEEAEGWLTTYQSQFTSQEERFVRSKVVEVERERYVGSPVLVETSGMMLGICEAALSNWAGLFFGAEHDRGTHEAVLTAKLAELPPSEASVPHVAVIRRTPAVSPWRVVMIGDDEVDLLRKNDMIVNLNPPPDPDIDFSWVKPGASSWDWWTESNNSISTELELKMVDFAAEMGWPYHTIDGGWYGFGRGPNHGPDVPLEPRAGFDLGRIVRHAREKGVDIWVWIHWMEIDDIGIDETFARLERWGVRGVKTDFINRQDQWIVNWYEKVCRAAARHRIHVNFHGAFKPTGTERTWPNNLTREGVLGNEMNIFHKWVTPEHCATLPFTRFLIGPGDFTPGSFGNVFSQDFRPQTKRGHRYGDQTDRCSVWAEEMGTRAHALAMCIAFDSYLTTLCDWPERYRGKTGCEVLRRLPTTWKSTAPLEGKCGEYYSVVREAYDGRVFLAAFTVKKRHLEVHADFLGDGEWKMTSFCDDVLASCPDAKSVVVETKNTCRGQKIGLSLVDEGGAVVVFERKGDSAGTP